MVNDEPEITPILFPVRTIESPVPINPLFPVILFFEPEVIAELFPITVLLVPDPINELVESPETEPILLRVPPAIAE